MADVLPIKVTREGYPKRWTNVADVHTGKDTATSTTRRTEPTVRTTKSTTSSETLTYGHYATGLRVVFSIPLRAGAAIVLPGETAPPPLV